MKMKNLLMTTIAIFGLAIFTNAQVPNYIPTNGLVGWWPFNGNANDESGNGNNGTVNGTNLTTDRFGNSNKAYNFNGTTDFIEVTHNSTLTFSTGVSFSFWLNIPDSSLNSIGLPERQPIGKQVSATASGIGFETTDATTPVLAPQFYVQGGAQYTDNFNLNVNAWIHLVGSYNGNTLKLYKDGILIGSDTGVFNLLTITENLFFGKEGILGRYFKGKLDDIGVWNKALTQAEITSLYLGSTVVINEVSQSNLFSVFPNPAQNVINVNLDAKLLGSVFMIYDNIGKAVKTGKLNSVNTTIDLNDLSGGIYTFSVGENKKQTFKVIKE